MFTTKPELGEKITKLGGGAGDAKTPFTERPATYASKSPGPSASKMVPSIIGEDLTIRGNVTSKGEIQVDGEIEGDIRCGSLLLGDKSQVTGGVAAEDVVVRGHIVGSVRGLRITLQAQSHVEGDIFAPEPCHRAGCLFRRKVAPLRQSTRGDQGSGRKWLGELRVPFREFTERGVSRRGGIAKGCRRVSASYCSDAYRSTRGKLDGHLHGFLVGRKRLEAGRRSCAQWATLDEAAGGNDLTVLGGKADILDPRSRVR